MDTGKMRQTGAPAEAFEWRVSALPPAGHSG